MSIHSLAPIPKHTDYSCECKLLCISEERQYNLNMVADMIGFSLQFFFQCKFNSSGAPALMKKFVREIFVIKIGISV
jgi:hypothetical protein